MIIGSSRASQPPEPGRSSRTDLNHPRRFDEPDAQMRRVPEGFAAKPKTFGSTVPVMRDHLVSAYIWYYMVVFL